MISRYSLDKEVFHGAGGVVYFGSSVVSGENVVIKRITKWEDSSELTVLKACQHIDGVVKLLDSFVDGSNLILIMPRIEHCVDLFEFLRHNRLMEDRAKRMFSRLVKTVSQIFEEGFIHRDIKLENIILNLDTDELTLIDFGAATQVSDEPFRKMLGTKIYLPPEYYLDNECLAMPLTVWSLGVVLCEMLTRKCPFKKVEDILEPLEPLNVSEAAQSVILACLDPDPKDRISLKEILTFSWFNE